MEQYEDICRQLLSAHQVLNYLMVFASVFHKSNMITKVHWLYKKNQLKLLLHKLVVKSTFQRNQMPSVHCHLTIMHNSTCDLEKVEIKKISNEHLKIALTDNNPKNSKCSNTVNWLKRVFAKIRWHNKFVIFMYGKAWPEFISKCKLFIGNCVMNESEFFTFNITWVFIKWNVLFAPYLCIKCSNCDENCKE